MRPNRNISVKGILGLQVFPLFSVLLRPIPPTIIKSLIMGLKIIQATRSTDPKINSEIGNGKGKYPSSKQIDPHIFVTMIESQHNKVHTQIGRLNQIITQTQKFRQLYTLKRFIKCKRRISSPSGLFQSAFTQLSVTTIQYTYTCYRFTILCTFCYKQQYLILNINTTFSLNTNIAQISLLQIFGVINVGGLSKELCILQAKHTTI